MALLLTVPDLFAQEPLVTQEYNRSSVSVVAVAREESYFGEEHFAYMIHKVKVPGKYDVNKIPTQTVMIKYPRCYKPFYQSGYSIPPERIHEVIDEANLGREVLGSVFNRQKDGTMDDSIIRERGLYNATDQDVLNSQASKIGLDLLAESGYQLIPNSYIMVLDVPWNNEECVYDDVALEGFVFKLDIDQDGVRDFLERTWIYPDDTEEVKAEKRKAFDDYRVGTTFVCSDIVWKIEHDGYSVMTAFNDLLPKLENGNPEWRTAVVISNLRPLRAKVGNKQSLKNGDLYELYSYTEDTEGNLKSIKEGYVRAINVAKNNTVATGDSPESDFCQISGLKSAQLGWTLKQINDRKISIGVSPSFHKKGPAGLRVDADWKSNFSNKGSETHVILSFIPDFQLFTDKGRGGVSIALGFGHSWNLVHMLTLMPYGQAGIMSIGDDWFAKEGETHYSGTGSYLEGGVRLSLSAMYPWEPFAAVSYMAIVNEKGDFDEVNEVLKAPYTNGPGMNIGVKFSF